jgi:YfiH family protein
MGTFWMSEIRLFEPQWALGGAIGAGTTTRAGGVSRGPYATLNLAGHVGDDPAAVAQNRARLRDRLGCRHIQWLDQVHGTTVVRATGHTVVDPPPSADAVWTTEPGLGLAVLTADCLPVVLAARDGSVVGIAHAGWRGLVGGVLVELLAALPCPPDTLAAWLGPAISRDAYEIGEDVAVQVRDLEAASGCLSPGAVPGKHHLDLFRLAENQLRLAGVGEVCASGVCTAADQSTYSYRRDGVTGRMATVCWIRER